MWQFLWAKPKPVKACYTSRMSPSPSISAPMRPLRRSRGHWWGPVQTGVWGTLRVWPWRSASHAGIKYILYYLYLTVRYVENLKKKKLDERLKVLFQIVYSNCLFFNFENNFNWKDLGGFDVNGFFKYECRTRILV